jgi:hypothetical protein
MTDYYFGKGAGDDSGVECFNCNTVFRRVFHECFVHCFSRY